MTILKSNVFILSVTFVKVVNKNCDFDGSYVALNSFGFGGANAHVLLKSNSKQKSASISHNIPRLVTVSGRTGEAVNNMLKKVHYQLWGGIRLYLYSLILLLDF